MAFLALDEIRSGYQIKQYELLEPVGFGGQGSIWSAIDHQERRVVALKLAPISPDDETVYAAELSHEAETVRQLAHPNILPIYEFGNTEKARYLSMMYAPGGSLFDRLRRSPLDIHNSLFVACQIAEALGFVHAQRVIHRDLKPSNILTDARSRIYLSDFGLARVVSDETKQLHTGHGTRSYAPPEQIMGRAVTHWSDIYSFGVVLYELFSGHLPWNGAKSLATSQMDEHERLPFPVIAPPEFSPALLEVLWHLTAIEQEDRPASVAEAFDEVCDALAGNHFPKDVLKRIRERAQAFSETQPVEIENAQDVLKKAARHTADKPGLTLSQFSLIDTARWRIGTPALETSRDDAVVMWEAALRHSRPAGRWWADIGTAAARMEACDQLIENADDLILERVIVLLATEPDEVLTEHPLSQLALRRLLEAGMGALDLTLQSRAIELVQRFPIETGRWQPFAFDESLDQRLGEMALGDTFAAEETARFIGQLHSEAALRIVLAGHTRAPGGNALAVLRAVAREAHSLPGFVPFALRLRVAASLAWSRLAAGPANLARVLAVSLLAGFLGLLLHFYLVISAPAFLDAERLIVALERALISGPFLGITIFIVRLLAARLSGFFRLSGIIASLAVGAVGFGLTFFLIDFLFLGRLPGILPVLLGGLIISLGFALAERRAPSVWPVRGLISAAGFWGAVTALWVLYLAIGVSPLFIYSDLWSPGQVLVSAAVVALVTGLVTHTVDLT